VTNRSAELVLGASYGDSTKELLDLVMAAEKAFNDFGKRSIFGKDKGQESKQKFTYALARAIFALKRVGKIKDPNDAEESYTALQNAMIIVRRAYPNWPRAYQYWDTFYANTYNKADPSQ
jgi:hypothetical protein